MHSILTIIHIRGNILMEDDREWINYVRQTLGTSFCNALTARINRETEGQRNTLAEAILLTRGHHSCLTSLPYPTMASRDAPPCFQSPWTRTHPAVRHAPPRFFHSFWLSLSPSTGDNMNFLDLFNGQLVYALPDRCHYRAKPKIWPRFAFLEKAGQQIVQARNPRDPRYIYNTLSFQSHFHRSRKRLSMNFRYVIKRRTLFTE